MDEKYQQIDDKNAVLKEIQELKERKSDLEHRIKSLESRLNGGHPSSKGPENSGENLVTEETAAIPLDLLSKGINESSCSWKVGSDHTLNAEMIHRYSRHLLLPSFGVQGQSRLLRSSILVVGAGGLGSPAALYLAASGIACLGIIDHDVVELNNLHRQVIHTEANIGELKVKSAAAACRAINSNLKVVEYTDALKASNALDIISKYDVVVDATDNVSTRYLINDSCVILGKPLVSGAALGLEGQLTVYHHNQGPCYRCLFPTPPPVGACQSCSDNGVLGVVPGIIGCLQALEAIKIASGVGEPLSGRMIIFDALPTRILTVKLRGRSLKCTTCGESPEISYENFQSFDYEKFTQSPMSDKIPSELCLLSSSQRVTSKEFKEHLESGKPYVLLDVRENHQYKIAALPDSLNIPLSCLETQIEIIQAATKEKALQNESQESMQFENSNGIVRDQTQYCVPLYVVCRRGNDSQKAVQYLRSIGFHATWDIVGGLESWTKDVDPNFPSY
eukprot:Gb_10591 [translate_table: standard]